MIPPILSIGLYHYMQLNTGGLDTLSAARDCGHYDSKRGDDLFSARTVADHSHQTSINNFSVVNDLKNMPSVFSNIKVLGVPSNEISAGNSGTRCGTLPVSTSSNQRWLRTLYERIEGEKKVREHHTNLLTG